MGGIPWQSKGCKTCRKRKIKCDEGKPECNRCIKRGLKCMGYADHPNFVGAPSVKRPLKPEDACCNEIQPARSPVTFSLPKTAPCGPAMRDLIFSSMMHISFPAEKLTSKVNLGYFLLSSIAGLPQKAPMVDKALSALSCLLVGNINQDRQLFQCGVNLYNDAIRRLSSAICRSMYNDDIVYTAYIFQEIESVHCPDNLEKWISHVQGMNAILTHYQSQASENPITDAIYHQQQKLNIIVSSAGMSITPQEYDHLMEPTEGNPLLELIQISAETGPLIATARNVEYLDMDYCQNILHQCYDLERRLIDVCAEGNLGQSPSDCPSIQFYSPEIPATEQLFGSAFDFSSPDDALLHTLFWSQLAIVHSVICTVSSSSSSIGHDASLIPPSEDENPLLATMYADKIARSVPYCTQYWLKHSCFRMLTFVMMVASTTFIDGGDQEKHEWSQGVFRRLGHEGYGIGLRVGEMLNATWEQRKVFPNRHVICLSVREEASKSVMSYKQAIEQDYESDFTLFAETPDTNRSEASP